jgi:hypothetical protein
MSETRVYFAQRRRFVARVHAFILPDWSVGASGDWDPIMLVEEGVTYERSHRPGDPCRSDCPPRAR